MNKYYEVSGSWSVLAQISKQIQKFKPERPLVCNANQPIKTNAVTGLWNKGSIKKKRKKKHLLHFHGVINGIHLPLSAQLKRLSNPENGKLQKYYVVFFKKEIFLSIGNNQSCWAEPR